MRIKKLSIQAILSIFLIITIGICSYSIYRKVKLWGFQANPYAKTDIWQIEASISFIPNGEPIKIYLAAPHSSESNKILEDIASAPNYKIKKIISKSGNKVIEFSSKPLKTNKVQTLYYRVSVFDKNQEQINYSKNVKTKIIEHKFSESEKNIAIELIKLAKNKYKKGDIAQKIIRFLMEETPNPIVENFIPLKRTPNLVYELTTRLLALEKIPTRISRGIRLAEERYFQKADFILEAYINGAWNGYDIKTGNKGVPKDFVLFQKGGESLLEVEGGYNSSVLFSVLKSVQSSEFLTKKRAELAKSDLFNYSIYSLPLSEQNSFKWLSIFPLAILVIVILRNIIGFRTMGTFTPILIAMSLMQTGLVAGIICFTIIISVGLVIRHLLSKLNLLLVPRISAVVIFVILIMEAMTIISHNFGLQYGTYAIFFPLIITAWIIERASITWEEDGAKNAINEIISSIFVAILTYAIISNDIIKHFMFTFSEINIIILSLVLLIGTYTGYRLTELTRFSQLVEKKEKEE